MSRIDRLVGLVRSLAIYHAIPLRQRRLRRLYARFVEPGDLVFDIGAHAGNRMRALARLGCRVVALEPQPDFARVLRMLFATSPAIEIVEAAAGDAPGSTSLLISERTPTVTTLAAAWREARAGDPDFVGVRWNRRMSFEYLPRAIDQVQACCARLTSLGPYCFNWSPGESSRLAAASWLNERELIASLTAPGAPRRAGDVYARLTRTVVG
jgi:FkbM family methyltransferase